MNAQECVCVSRVILLSLCFCVCVSARMGVSACSSFIAPLPSLVRPFRQTTVDMHEVCYLRQAEACASSRSAPPDGPCCISCSEV